MQTITFNTHREYTTQGQRISAALLDNGDIYFVDVDRGIDGVIKANGLTRQDVIEMGLFTQRSIMADYDNGLYAWGRVPEGLRAELTAQAEAQ